MKKLKLDPEELAVESFDAEAGPDGGQGTVRGHNWTQSPEECTCYGRMCGTTAAPGQLCACIPWSAEPCSSDFEVSQPC
jgi:hypothetical protein